MIEDRKYRDFYLHAERSAEQRRKDLVNAFDQIYELKCIVRSLNTRIWVLSGALMVLLPVAGWLATRLYACVTGQASLN
jgi:hypothetical protein